MGLGEQGKSNSCLDFDGGPDLTFLRLDQNGTSGSEK